MAIGYEKVEALKDLKNQESLFKKFFNISTFQLFNISTYPTSLLLIYQFLDTFVQIEEIWHVLPE
jgi:hypothetical protein